MRVYVAEADFGPSELRSPIRGVCGASLQTAAPVAATAAPQAYMYYAVHAVFYRLTAQGWIRTERTTHHEGLVGP